MSPRREHESVSAIRSTHPYSAVISDRGLYTHKRKRERLETTPHTTSSFLVAFAVSHVDSHRGIIPFTIVTRDRGRSNVTAFSTVSTCSPSFSVSPPLFPCLVPPCPLFVLVYEAPLEICIEEPPRRKSLALRVIIAAIITRS